MSHILNFKEWFRVYESAGFKYQPGLAIFESVDPNNPTAIEPGDGDFGDLFNSLNFQTNYIENSNLKSFGNKLQIIGKAGAHFGLEATRSASSYSLAKKDEYAIGGLLRGIFWASQDALKSAKVKAPFKYKGDYNSFAEYVMGSREYAGKLGLTLSAPIEVPINFADQGSVYTVGNVKGPQGPVNEPDNQRKSTLSYFIKYLNNYNICNFATGHAEQYDIALDSNGYIDLKVTKTDVSDKWIFYSEGTPEVSSIAREEGGGKESVVGAQPGGSDSVAIGYGNMKYNVDTNGKAIDANHPEVQRVAKGIISAIGEATDVKVDTITLTSSASTSWNGKKMSESSGTGEPGAGQITAANFATNPAAVGNEYLAWLRGNTFLEALKSALGELSAETTTVNWKVSDAGLAGGKNISFEWTKIQNPGKKYTKPGTVKSSVSTSKLPSGATSGKIYKYEVTWDKTLGGLLK